MAVKLKDVAERAGVSLATASQVMNNRKTTIRVSDATRAKIQQAAKELCYRPNPTARNLRLQRTNTIGLVSYDAKDPLAVSIASSLDHLLSSRDYRMVIGDAQHDQRRAVGHLTDFIDSKMDGVILLASSFNFSQETMESVFRDENRMVCVGGDMTEFGVRSYMVDSVQGGRMAAKHLLVEGYRRIAIIAGPEVYAPDSRDRLEGALEALSEGGIDLPPDRIVRERQVGWDPNVGYQSMEMLLKGSSVPDAVIAFDDCTAYGAIRAACAHGMRVPDDVAVIGFDDLLISAFYNPPLTTLKQPIDELSSAAVDCLLTLIEKKTVPETRLTKLKPSLIVRESTKSRGE